MLAADPNDKALQSSRRNCTHRGMARKRRRGVVVVQVSVMLVVLFGMAAMTIDLSYLWNVRSDLQRAADAAALAAAARLAEVEDPAEKARAAAYDYIQRNPVMNSSVTLSPDDATITLGRAVLVDGEYEFTPVGDHEFADAVRVRVQASRGLFFGRILGRDAKTLGAEATALLIPRDISIVADLSASHNDDSELGSYRDTPINIWDVWGSLPGGSDSGESTWTPESLAGLELDPYGFHPQAAGPAWGYFRNLKWGEASIDETYQPNNDPGLIHLPRYGSGYSNWDSPDLINFLATTQFENNAVYNGTEVQQILNTANHGSLSRYYRQTAAALGLARWDSGKPGGAWESIPGAIHGNGDNRVDSWELTWVEPYFDQPGSRWLDYVQWATSSWSRMEDANGDFRYAFGPKTFTNFLMEQRFSHEQTPELAATPHQPMQAVKDAVELMIDLVSSFENGDQIALEVYGYTAVHRVPLTQYPFLEEITTGVNGISNMQAGHLDGWTNMGGGLEMAIETLTTEPARSGVHKMIILLTDGQANINEAGEWPPSGDTDEAERVQTEARDYVLRMAQQAADNGIRIFAVSVGAYADTELMDAVAAMANGEHLQATSNIISEYQADLQEIFVRLGGKRPVELIQ